MRTGQGCGADKGDLVITGDTNVIPNNETSDSSTGV